MTKDKRSDEELVKAFLDGDGSALDILLERYQEIIWYYARRLSHYKDDAFIDDIRQQVLMGIFKDLNDRAFKPAEAGSFRNWVHTIIRHKCINANKHLKYQPEPISQLFPDELPDIIDERTIDSGEDDIRDDRVEKVLARLNDEERLLLRFMAEHKPYEEIVKIKPFDKYKDNLPTLRQKTCRLRRYLIELYKNKT
ncbi:MAG: RNA polymerase sigma factor [Planctomycetota bacterium]